ncbi:hypothetical protein ABL78_3344 [Leptomonas seymouri]|uniref:Uncharacterized protein n=1 Tax=Leptomonas seymouri TaxID=5684 RepID=A0A0N1PCJ2_LEPSE|nr:hypothetical protein ABL78_3344 [Leptomonas seymouri]|eukprot:KPI87593.1 hypothetical protein ABL78_3344 [Leptomonas seymouri]
MHAQPHVLLVPGLLAATAAPQSSSKQTSTALDDYVLSETLFLPSAVAAAPRDRAAIASKLNGIASKYVHFHRSISPCALASCYDVVPHSKTAASSRSADPPQSPSENVKSAHGAERPRGEGSLKPATATSCAPPHLESFWLATSPLPPTAVLTALHSLLPLRHVSIISSDTHDSSSTGGSGAKDAGVIHAESPTASLEILWTLCRAAESDEPDERAISFWEAFSMTAMTVHRAAGGANRGDTNGPSASPFSLSQQLRRATAVLSGVQQSSATAAATAAPVANPSASLLEWPEEFLWNLLMSLLSVLALAHSAGLHFFGQLTASNVLCFSCTSSVPRLLQQTWRDVVAANVNQRKEAGRVDSAALFRQFYSMVGRSVLLPQAPLTAETPCHSAFFVVQPSLELLSRRRTMDETDAPSSVQIEDNKSADSPVAATSAAQDVADETPEQQARFQAADLASVGHLLTTIMDLRAQGLSDGGQRLSSAAAAAQPSSELVFLVRRLCECEAAAEPAAATSSNLPRSCPTALQLLQLQALRLRTETWYYRRLCAEAYDSLAQLQLSQQASKATESSSLVAQGAEAERRMAAREAAVAEREEKLDLILRIYELTHEHLDAVQLPKSQPPSTNTNGSSYHVDQRDEKTPGHSKTHPEDSLEALLSSPTYRQAVTVEATSQAAAPRSEGREVPAPSVSYQQQREAFANATTETSGDALLGLSPLVRAFNTDSADTTLLSASATAFTSLREADQFASKCKTHPLPSSVSTTHRMLEVGGPARTSIATTQKASELPTSASQWTATEVRPISQTVVTANANAVITSSHALRGPARLTPLLPPNEQVHAPWDTSQAQAQQQQHQNFDSQQPQAHRHDIAQTNPHSQVTVVEVMLDDSSDDEDMTKAQPNAFASGAAGLSPTRSVAQDERQTLKTMPYESQLVSSSPPPLPFFSFTSASPASRPALDSKTPVRAPTLSNMGMPDADVSGISTGVVGGGLSKFSSLAQLRSPLSARRPTTGSARNDSSLSPSPHSPKSYRSSTMPNIPVDLDCTTTASGALNAAQQEPAQQRSARRRSGSRGSSSGAHRDNRLSASVNSGDGAAPTPGPNNENGEWARQQLTELQNMQTALRSQPLATPRSRASGSTGAAGATESAATGAELKTPELRLMRSPASSASSPPLRSAPGAVSALSSPSLPMMTPIRHSTHADRSPVGTDSSHRARSSQRHLQSQQPPDYLLDNLSSTNNNRGGIQCEERPAQVQGTLCSATSTMKTSLSSRRRHEDTRPTSAAHRPTPVLSGRSTPPAKSTHLSSKPITAGSAAADSRRTRSDVHASSLYPPTAAIGAHTTSSTAAVLGVALRTPLRQTAPATTAADASEHRRLTGLACTSHVPSPSSSASRTLSSAKKRDGAVSTAPRGRHGTSANGGATAAASVGSTPLPTNAATTTAARTTAPTTMPVPSRNVGVEVTLRRFNGGGGLVNSARGRSSGGAKASSDSASLRQNGVEADVPSSSSASPSTGLESTSTPANRKGAPQLHGNASSTSAVELLRRLRASSSATV